MGLKYTNFKKEGLSSHICKQKLRKKGLKRPRTLTSKVFIEFSVLIVAPIRYPREQVWLHCYSTIENSIGWFCWFAWVFKWQTDGKNVPSYSQLYGEEHCSSSPTSWGQHCWVHHRAHIYTQELSMLKSSPSQSSSICSSSPQQSSSLYSRFLYKELPHASS